MTGQHGRDEAIRGRIAFSTAINYAAKFLILGIGFFLTPFTLHHLGESGFGLWTLVGSVVGYGALLDFGISGALTKYVAEYRARQEAEELGKLVSTSVALYMVLGLCALILSAGIALIFPVLFNVAPDQRGVATRLVLLVGLGLAISIPTTAPGAVLRGLQRFDLANVLGVGGILISAIGTVVVLLLGGGVISLALVNLAVTLIMQPPSIYLIRRAAPDLAVGYRAVSRRMMRKVMSFSSSVFLIGVAGQLQTETDKIVIGLFLPLSAVAPYAVAQRLSGAPHMLTNQFMKVLLPLASELHSEQDWRRLRSLYLSSTRLTLAIFAPVAVTLVILAGAALKAWVGGGYTRYAFIVVILVAAGLLDSVLWPAGFILQGMSRHRLLAVLSLGSGLANLAISLALVPHFGLAGVALGTLIPTAVESIFVVQPYAARVLGVRLRSVLGEVYLPVLVPTALAATAVYVLKLTLQPGSLPVLAVVGAAALAVYAAAYVALGASRTERDALIGFLAWTMRVATARLGLP